MSSAGLKRTWKFHRLLDDLVKWSAYLEQSAECFHTDLATFDTGLIDDSAYLRKLHKEILGCLTRVKKESAQLRKVRNLHGYRR